MNVALLGNAQLKVIILLVMVGFIACAFIHRKSLDHSGFVTWASQNSKPPIVAILPFTNQTNQNDLPRLVRAGFYSHFSPLPFKDLEIHEIDQTLDFLEKQQQKSYQTFSIPELGALLGCHALVYGEVTTFTKFYAGVYSQIGIGAKIRIIEAEGGQTIWEDSFTTRFHEGGIPLNQVTAAFSLVKSGLHLRNAQELRAIDDLCRNLVARVPTVTFPKERGRLGVNDCELQIAAFKDFMRANALQKELKEKQYAAFIRTVKDDGVMWHRVLLGPFECGQEIDFWKEKVITELGMNPVVVKTQITNDPIKLENRKE
ncbi:MAG: SPOR domain-containing protein [Pseudomonadota bacterium]